MDHSPSATSRSSCHEEQRTAPDTEISTARVENAQANRRIRTAGHIPKLDSLRGAAILLVVTYHAYGGSVDYRNWHGACRYLLYLSRYGYTGVELFFVLSGFLITTILLSSKHHADFYTNFYKRRALRILPAYLAILIVIKIWLGVSWRYILACLLYIANMAGLLGARTSEYAPLWSLAVEEQFYLIWPFCIRKLTTRSLFRVAVGICLLMPFLRLIASGISPSIDIRYKTYFIADYVAYGAVIAIALRLKIIHAGNMRFIMGSLLLAGSCLSCAVLYLGYRPHDSKMLDLMIRSWGVLPFCWIYCGLVLNAIERHHLGDNQSNRFLAFFGYISYGLYLIHEFIFNEYSKLTFDTRLGRQTDSMLIVTVRFLVVGAISVLVAYLSRRFYEDYFLRMGRRKSEATLP